MDFGEHQIQPIKTQQLRHSNHEKNKIMSVKRPSFSNSQHNIVRHGDLQSLVNTDADNFQAALSNESTSCRGEEMFAPEIIFGFLRTICTACVCASVR
jgi:hypothetical protein